MTLEDDIRIHEAHTRIIEVAKAANPKIAKIQAKRDIKVARAKSQTEDTRLARIIAPCVSLVAVVVICSIAGCSAVVFQPDPAGDKITQEKYTLCVEAGGDWSSDFEDCDFEDD